MPFNSDRRSFITQNALALTACALPLPAFQRQEASVTVADLPTSTIEKFTSTVKGQIAFPNSAEYRTAGQLWRQPARTRE